jgi:hypothetical protein
LLPLEYLIGAEKAKPIIISLKPCFRLALALFMPGILAYHPHHALAPDDLAVPADLLH